MKSKEVLSLLKISRQTLTKDVKNGTIKVKVMPNVSNTLEQIDFSNENPIWVELEITTQRTYLRKRYMKKICDYFINKLR